MLAVALVGTTIGCGGTSAKFDSPFAGNWSGTFHNSSVSQTGTMLIVIDIDGSSNGTATNTTLGVTYSLSGFIGTDGTIDWGATGSETGNLQGTLAISSANNHLIGTVSQTFGPNTIASTIDLTKQ